MATSSSDIAQRIQALQALTSADKSRSLTNALFALGAGASKAGAPTLGRPNPFTLGEALGQFGASIEDTRQRAQREKLLGLQSMAALQQVEAGERETARIRRFTDNKENMIKAVEGQLTKNERASLNLADTPTEFRDIMASVQSRLDKEESRKFNAALQRELLNIRTTAEKERQEADQSFRKELQVRDHRQQLSLQRRDFLSKEDLQKGSQAFQAEQNDFNRAARAELKNKDIKAAFDRLGITNDFKLRMAREKLANEMAIAKTKAVKLSDVSSMRSQYRQAVSGLEEAQLGLEKVREGAKEDSGPGDIALIFGFMKVIDPRSTVREGEATTVEETAGIPTKIRNLYNRVVSGERLSPEQRASIAKASESQFRPYAKAKERLDKSFRDLATRNGINPDDVIVGFGGSGVTKGPPRLDLGLDGLDLGVP